METLLPMSCTALLLIASFIFLLIKLCKKTRNKSPAEEYRNLPPSPPKLPVIGHLHHLIGGLPHHALRRLTQKYGPVLHLQLGEVSAVVISSRQAAKEALKASVQKSCFTTTPTLFSARTTSTGGKCVKYALSSSSTLKISLQSSSREGHDLVNLTDKIFGFTSSVLCRAAFGKVTRGREKLQALLKKVVPLLAGFGLADLFPSFKLLHVLCWNKYKLLNMRRQLDAFLEIILEVIESRQ
ncbi:hypothetical protein CASFOL_038490 [Castilleja foliolosa]|uniref:Cytochrome P450 n=1 Tax=Castilleja foliolosa TaxID=1961234 RepID=A0ABD3BLS7_9LAMI